MAIRISKAFRDAIEERLREQRIRNERFERNLIESNVGEQRGSNLGAPSSASQPSALQQSRTSGSGGGGGGGGRGGSGGGGGGGGTDTGTDDDTAAEEEEELSLTILSSPNLRWFQDSETGLFYASYQLPGGGGEIIFEAEDEQIQALFDGASEPDDFQKFNFDKAIRNQNKHFGGNVSEVEGEGVFEEEVNRVISLTLDQGGLPDWIREDQKALDLLWVKVTEDRTEDWFYENLSSLQSFKKRYPGAAALESRGLSIREAVRAHTEFESKLKTLHAASGFDSQGVTPDIVGNLIEKGYSAKQVADSYQVWKRMSDHAPALEAFNRVLQAQGKQPLQGEQIYEFLQGNAPQDIYDTYEASAITEAADAAGLADMFDVEDALSLATATEQDLTRSQAFEGFQTVATQALRFRHQLNLQQYDLSVDDLVDLQFGQAPRSGKSASEVGEILARITQQAEGFLKEKATPFFGFTESGRPQAQSFGELRQGSV